MDGAGGWRAGQRPEALQRDPPRARQHLAADADADAARPGARWARHPHHVPDRTTPRRLRIDQARTLSARTGQRHRVVGAAEPGCDRRGAAAFRRRGRQAMSVRAELARLMLRLMFKRTRVVKPDLAKIRRGIERTTWWVRNPPRSTRSAKVDMGGTPAVRGSTPRSQEGRHILYLHGGAYIYGSPLLYRDLAWRIANAAQ